MGREAFYREMTAFLSELNTHAGDHPVEVDVAPDENLFDLGYLTSLSIAQVLLFLEGIAGRRIDPAGRAITDFATLNGLYDVLQPHLAGHRGG